MWKPIASRSTCIPIEHPDYTMPYGQTVDDLLFADESQFYCLNRGDANPFLKTEDDSKTWTQWMNIPCPINQYSWERRCLGSRPDTCVEAICKFFLS